MTRSRDKSLKNAQKIRTEVSVKAEGLIQIVTPRFLKLCVNPSYLGQTAPHKDQGLKRHNTAVISLGPRERVMEVIKNHKKIKRPLPIGTGTKGYQII